MKLRTAILAAAVALGLAAAACKKTEERPPPAAAPAVAAEYACPMHPEVKGKAGDKCPKCGMALEPVKK